MFVPLNFDGDFLSKKTRFVLKENITKDRFFNQMVDDIGFRAKLSPNVVRILGRNAFQRWSSEMQTDISTIYRRNNRDRGQCVDTILSHFQDELALLLKSEKQLKNSMRIAEKSLEMMFFL